MNFVSEFPCSSEGVNYSDAERNVYKYKQREKDRDKEGDRERERERPSFVLIVAHETLVRLKQQRFSPSTVTRPCACAPKKMGRASDFSGRTKRKEAKSEHINSVFLPLPFACLTRVSWTSWVRQKMNSLSLSPRGNHFPHEPKKYSEIHFHFLFPLSTKTSKIVLRRKRFSII